MFCPKCGGEVGSQPFCKFCGATGPWTSQQSPPASPVRALAPLPEVAQLTLTPVVEPKREEVRFLQCKVCERGVLVSKKTFRMSGPVIAIGYILMIPSILGMVGSALVFLGVFAHNGAESSVATNEPTQEDFDIEFRRSCVNKAEPSVPVSTVEQYCECALAEYKVSNSAQSAGNACVQKLENGTLAGIDQETQRLYSSLIGNSSPPSVVVGETTQQGDGWLHLLHIIGGGFAIILGITSFVGGLLGWLLVMKKHILQCSVCGATVSAS